MTGSRPRLVLGTCCGAHALHDGLVDMLYALLPLLREAFGLDYAQVGLVRAANRAATAAFQIPAGLLAERLGERGLLAVGTATAGVGLIGLAFSSGLAGLLACIFVVGLGGAVQHPLSSSLITAAYPGAGRRVALGAYNTAGDVGKFAFMGGTVLATGFGLAWQAPVLAYGAIAIAVAVGLLAALALAGAGARPERTPEHVARSLAGGWGVRHRAGFVSLGAIAALDNTTRNGFLTFVAFAMIDKGVPVAWAASAVLATLLGGMLGKLACGLLAERVGVTRTIAITEVATSAGMLLVLVAPPTWAFLALPLVGVFLNGTTSAIYGSVGELIDDHRHARAFGLMYTLGSACGLVAPLIYGALADAAGVEVTLAVTAAVVLLTLPLCAVLGPALHGVRTMPAARGAASS